MPTKKKPVTKSSKKPVKKAPKKVVAKQAGKNASKKSGKRQYSKAERTVLIVAYSAFASVFVLFASETGGSNIWYYILAFVCLAMVMRHCAGILKTYGEK